jgi:site-specific recombinase XerD
VGRCCCFWPPRDLYRRRHHHRDLEEFFVHLLNCKAPATVSNRSRALEQFFRWMETEGYRDANPMAKIRPRHVPEQPVDVLTEDQMRRLLADPPRPPE